MGKHDDFWKAVKIMAKWSEQGYPPLIGGTQAEQVKWAQDIFDQYARREYELPNADCGEQASTPTSS